MGSWGGERQGKESILIREMVDVHCHVDLFPNPKHVIQEAELKGIFVFGVTNLPSHFEKGLPHVRSLKNVRLALGMHPLYAYRHKEEYYLFEKLIDKTSYIGEIGLDFSKEGVATKDEQKDSFDFVLKTLKGKRKLLSLHSRGAEREVLSGLLRSNIRSAIFHWYSGPIELVKEICSAGYMFSINPAMVKSKAGCEIIRQIPSEHLLTESDGPFVVINDRPACPTDMSYVEREIAHIKGIPGPDISNLILNNFKRLIDNIR
jgi:TatD DNase family protein